MEDSCILCRILVLCLRILYSTPNLYYILKNYDTKGGFNLSSKSIAFRALLSLILMIGFYCLAIAISGILIYIPYAEWTYAGKLHLKLAFFCVAGAAIILISLIPRRIKFTPPGPRVNQKDNPELFKEITDIANKTNQKMPDEVYILADVNAWVSERGGIIGFGRKRIMGIGLPLMQVLTVSQFRAVLAHEFGHYHGGDTKLAPWVYKTRRAIENTLEGLSEHSSLLQLPFVWYGKLFLRVSHAVSRAQEFVADKLAASIVGAEHMIEGLCITHGTAPVFDPFWKNEVIPVLGSGYLPGIAKGFEKYLHSTPISGIVSNIIQEEMDNPKSSPYSTHPPLKERIEAIKNVNADNKNINSELAITLLEDVSTIEKQILYTIADNRKVNALKPVDWKDVGEHVYIPFWDSMVSKQPIALKDFTLRDLPAISQDMKGFISKLNREGYDGQPPEQQVYSLFGAALAYILFRKGWNLEALPGEEVILMNGDTKIEPFKVLMKLVKGEIEAEAWMKFCDDAGISEIDLGRVAVGGEQRELQFA